MPGMIPAARQHLIDAIARASRAAGRSRGGIALPEFVQAYYRGVGEDDLRLREPAQFARAAREHLAFGRVRRPGEPLVRVFNPDPERDGWASALHDRRSRDRRHALPGRFGRDGAERCRPRHPVDDPPGPAHRARPDRPPAEPGRQGGRRRDHGIVAAPGRAAHDGCRHASRRCAVASSVRSTTSASPSPTGPPCVTARRTSRRKCWPACRAFRSRKKSRPASSCPGLRRITSPSSAIANTASNAGGSSTGSCPCRRPASACCAAARAARNRSRPSCAANCATRPASRPC